MTNDIAIAVIPPRPLRVAAGTVVAVAIAVLVVGLFASIVVAARMQPAGAPADVAAGL